ncbi:hypothetical protein [Sphingomonas faeni]|uniref:hypothetical protein n=1 Tax=Sphingomonas faeni TaxID=185950 RepID=UPI00334DAF53
MADNPEFYRARADEERRNGDAALLDNVRDRCRRAEKAWDEMASRAERTQVLRAAREAAPPGGERMMIGTPSMVAAE